MIRSKREKQSSMRLGTLSRTGIPTSLLDIPGRVGQLSEVKSDPDGLTVMTSIMINRLFNRPEDVQVSDTGG